MNLVEQMRRSKHTYRLVWRGAFIGWRSHTKSYSAPAERRAARKREKSARRANR